MNLKSCIENSSLNITVYVSAKNFHYCLTIHSLKGNKMLTWQQMSFFIILFMIRFNADVITERRIAILTLLEYVAKQPELFTSDVFVKFFEVSS